MDKKNIISLKIILMVIFIIFIIFIFMFIKGTRSEPSYSYNIEFDLDGGRAPEHFEVEPDRGNITKNVYEGESSLEVYEGVTLSIHDPVRPGYKFIGWKLDGEFDVDNAYAGGSIGKYVKDGYYNVDTETWDEFLDDVNYTNILLKNIGEDGKTVKLVAQWKEAYSYNIKFDLDGGRAPDYFEVFPDLGNITKNVYEGEDSLEVYEGVTLYIHDSVRPGYKFIGWKLENFDIDNAYVGGSIGKYVKDGYYNVDTETWDKFLDDVNYTNILLKNIGEDGKTVKLVAQWEEAYSYDIKFDLQGGRAPDYFEAIPDLGNITKNVYEGESSLEVYEGVILAIYEPVRPGYKFIGWKLEKFDVDNAEIYNYSTERWEYIKDGYYNVDTETWDEFLDDVNYIGTVLKNIGEDGKTVKLVAQWKELYSYEIEFDLQGGEGRDGYDYSSRLIEENEGINIGDPIKKGSNFIGWKLEGELDVDNAYVSSSNISRYVKDGYYNVDTQVWNEFIHNDSWANLWLANIGTANGKVKIVAQWEEPKYSYTIKFDLNEGEGRNGYNYGEREVNEGEKIWIGDPIKENSKFIGWKLENFDIDNAYIGYNVGKYVKDGYYDVDSNSWKNYVDEKFTDVILKNLGKKGQTVTLIAQWEEAYSYKINFDLQDGKGRNGYDYSSRTVYEGEIVPIGDPIKENSKFVGWTLEGDFDEDNAFILSSIDMYIKDKYYNTDTQEWKNYIDTNSYIYVNLMDFGKSGGEVTLVAQWADAYSYNVKFDLNGGKGRNGYDYTEKLVYEDVDIAVGDPERLGYKFIGWKLENFDIDNAYIIDGVESKYVNNGNYSVSSSRWLKYVDDVGNVDVRLKNLGEDGKEVTLVAQWEKIVSFTDNVSVDEDNKYLKFTRYQLKKNDILKEIQTDGEVTILDSNGNVVVDDIYIGTGYKVKIKLDGVEEIYTIVISGDANGDGVVNSMDLVMLRKHIVGYINPVTGVKEVMTGEYEEALDISNEGSINSLDLVRMRMKIVGLE